MTGWTSFKAAVEPLIWGDKTYTILRLPPEVEAALGAARRVEGEIAEHPVNLAPTRAPVVDGAFLWTGASLLQAIGIAPGEVVEIRLRPADPEAVETPDDVSAALRAAGRTADWEALTPGRRRALLHGVATVKRPDTRARRIAGLVSTL